MTEQSVLDAINAKLTGDQLNSLKDMVSYPDSEALRQVVHETAVKHGWFKSVSGGELLGDSIFPSVFTRMKDTDFYRKLEKLERWVLAEQ